MILVSDKLFIFFLDELRFIALGDWGERSLPGQELVAAQMAVWAQDNNPEYILTTGDNIYPDGISSVDDPQMDRSDCYLSTILLCASFFKRLDNPQLNCDICCHYPSIYAN